MRDLNLDASTWKNADDFYSAFFKAVGAPEWHGRNFNALDDSIAHGRINEIEVPYRIVIRNTPSRNYEIGLLLRDFENLIQELAARGCPFEIQIDASAIR
jgi:RNAse (barnase) inhibitor barstar